MCVWLTISKSYSAMFAGRHTASPGPADGVEPCRGQSVNNLTLPHGEGDPDRGNYKVQRTAGWTVDFRRAVRTRAKEEHRGCVRSCRTLIVSGFALLIILSGIVSATGGMRLARLHNPSSSKCSASKTVRDEPPKDENADRFGLGDWYVNAPRTIWVRNSQWHAGEDGNKVIWIRPAGTQLLVTGKRQDAEALPLRVSADRGYLTGFTVIDVHFPTEGCWEVTAKAGTSELRFVTQVEAAGKDEPKTKSTNCEKKK